MTHAEAEQLLVYGHAAIIMLGLIIFILLGTMLQNLFK